MDVERCDKLVEIPAALTRWKRALAAFTAKTGKTIPDDWIMPILFKMIPKSSYERVKLQYKYAPPEQKSFEGFSQVLIDLADEQSYETRSKNRDDMDVDAADAFREPQDVPQDYEYADQEMTGYQRWLEEELHYVGKGKGKSGASASKGKGKGKGKGNVGTACNYCGKDGHFRK